MVATSLRAKCRDFILPVHLDTSTRPPFLWIFSAVEPLDVTCLHSVTLYLTYSTDLPMYMYQALLAALLPPIVVADGEYLVSLFCEIFSYYNAICKPPHWVAFHPQTAVSANTDAVSEKIQGLYKLVPEKNDCYTFEFNFRHSTSKRARQFLFMKVITKGKTSPLFVSQILCVQKAFLMFKMVQINHNIIWNPAALCCCLIILFEVCLQASYCFCYPFWSQTVIIWYE